ncbi:MAG: AAA family ATPase, partial [Chloroflexi bacterium]|nr:AAA family ATPase [Chloroflexota bacterium]
MAGSVPHTATCTSSAVSTSSTSGNDKRMFLTEAQQAAIHNHEDNLIVVAGAGSGKTFVLVERYLALLDRHPEWPLNALVAITFTQKAAQEMRDRVRQHLQRRADERDGEAAAQWAGRLAAMDSARIDTIHGLCAVILRGNAAEAGVDPGFEVLDEIEAGVLLEDAIDDVLRSLAADDPVLELFAEYGERGVRGLLNQTSKLQILSEFNPKTDDLFTDWLAQWVADSHKAIERFVTTLSRADFYAPIGVDSLSQRWQDVGEVAEWFAASPQQTERALLYVYVDQVKRIADLRIPGARHKDWGDDWDDSKAAFTVIRDAAKDTLSIIEDAPGALDLRAARLLPLWGAIAAKVRAAYRLAKDERGALDFDD